MTVQRASANTKDFTWSQKDEPHHERKLAILEKHGDEIRKLMKPEWRTVPIVLALVAIQLAAAVVSRDWGWAPFLATAYVVGGTINHALFLAIHEIVHMLAVKSAWGNKLLACVANIPICIPYSSTFHGYHMEHHRYQGYDGLDTDVPTHVEALVLQNPFTKFLFCVFQILFYALRPMLVHPPKITTWTLLNWCVQVPAMMAVVELWGPLPLFYFLLSTFFAGCLHPVSGHFLSEHFEFVDGSETYSYYGPLNYLAFNVGYHNEHHDFPNIPWSGLPKVREIAPEFYNDLPQTPSWPGAIYEFVTSSKMTGFARVKRYAGGYVLPAPSACSRLTFVSHLTATIHTHSKKN